MGVIHAALDRARESGGTFEEAAADLVEEYRREKRRMAGFGHRIHTDDPRTARLFSLAEELSLAGDGITMLRALGDALAESLGRRLPINVDGAIAGVLVDLGVPAELANAFFIIARVPGLVAQAHEDQTRQRPMRVIHPRDHSYDGPPARSLEEEK